MGIGQVFFGVLVKTDSLQSALAAQPLPVQRLELRPLAATGAGVGAGAATTGAGVGSGVAGMMAANSGAGRITYWPLISGCKGERASSVEN